MTHIHHTLRYKLSLPENRVPPPENEPDLRKDWYAPLRTAYQSGHDRYALRTGCVPPYVPPFCISDLHKP